MIEFCSLQSWALGSCSGVLVNIRGVARNATSISYGAEAPVFLICFSCIFCCLRFIPTWHAVSKSVSASSSIGLIHRPHKFPNSFFQCLGNFSEFFKCGYCKTCCSSSSSFIVLKEYASDKYIFQFVQSPFLAE